MAIILRVQWVNKDHELLTSDAWTSVFVSAGGVTIEKRGFSQGFPLYEIPDGYQTLMVEFAVIGAKTLEHGAQIRPWRKFRGEFASSKIPMEPNRPVLLWARQEFAIIGTGSTPLEPIGTPHPLIACLPAGPPDPGITKVQVFTEFLDVTDYVFDLEKERAFLDTYVKAHQREQASNPGNPVHLTALGFTGGKPKLCFASYNESRVADLAGTEAGTFVFYRPATHPYARVAVKQTGFFYRMTRYCLAPSQVEVEEGNTDASDRLIGIPKPHGRVAVKGTCVRVGMDETLRKCGKRVVMLTPYPHESDYGLANSREAISYVENALRFLHANGEIGRNQPHVTLGRLGVGAYSAGGRPFSEMFKQCNDRISEVYLFDPAYTMGISDRLIEWAWSRPDVRLRISMGWNEIQLQPVYAKSLEFISVKGSQGFTANNPENITAWPKFKEVRELRDAYQRSEWWQYHIQNVVAVKPIPPGVQDSFRHQFAMFAGEQRPVTFFEQWLRLSGFPE